MTPQEKEILYEEFEAIDATTNENLEFIDGETYLLDNPSIDHQRVIKNLSTKFETYFKEKVCKYYIAPFDIVLKNDDWTNKVQPDIAIICDKRGLGNRNYIGIPTLIVEVVSPSTASNDYIRKMSLYMKSGIEEYWIVSPQNRTVQTFILLKNSYYSEALIYFMDDVVKSFVFKDLSIKLGDIFE